MSNPIVTRLKRLLFWALAFGLMVASTGCNVDRQPIPKAVEKPNPYNTRMSVSGVEKKYPRMEDLYPSGEKPIVKIIKGRVADPEELAIKTKAVPEQALKGMGQTIRSLILREVPVSLMTELLTRLCGTNVVPTQTVKDMKISIYMQDISLRSALETICRLNDLWYREGHNIVTLMTRDEYVRDIEIRQTEHTRSFSIKYTNAADIAKIIQALMGSEVYLSEIEDEKIYGHVDPESKVELEGEYKGAELNTSAQRIIFMDRLGRGSMDRAGEVVPNARQTVQEAVETPGTAGGTEAKKKPLLAIVTVFKRNNSIIARSLDQKLLNEMARIIEVLDTPTAQVLLEVKILNITLGDEFESFFQFNSGDYSKEPVGSNLRPGEQILRGFGIDTLASAAASSSTIGGVLTLKNLEARISLFQEEGRVNTVSSPFLMSANNSTVNFFVERRCP